MQKCTIDDCVLPAEYTFVWPWGSDGGCCEGHKNRVLQTVQNTRGTSSRISITKLNPDRPQELTRDERVMLHSQRLTAESERDDASRRAAKLFEANTELANDLRIHKTRCEQLEADVKALRGQVEAAIAERDQALLAAATAQEAAEVGRMQELEEEIHTLTAERDLAREVRDRTLQDFDRQQAALKRHADEILRLNEKLSQYRVAETPVPGETPMPVEETTTVVE